MRHPKNENKSDRKLVVVLLFSKQFRPLDIGKYLYCLILFIVIVSKYLVGIFVLRTFFSSNKNFIADIQSQIFFRIFIERLVMIYERNKNFQLDT